MKQYIALFIAILFCLGGLTPASAATPTRDLSHYWHHHYYHHYYYHPYYHHYYHHYYYHRYHHWHHYY